MIHLKNMDIAFAAGLLTGAGYKITPPQDMSQKDEPSTGFENLNYTMVGLCPSSYKRFGLCGPYCNAVQRGAKYDAPSNQCRIPK